MLRLLTQPKPPAQLAAQKPAPAVVAPPRPIAAPVQAPAQIQEHAQTPTQQTAAAPAEQAEPRVHAGFLRGLRGHLAPEPAPAAPAVAEPAPAAAPAADIPLAPDVAATFSFPPGFRAPVPPPRPPELAADAGPPLPPPRPRDLALAAAPAQPAAAAAETPAPPQPAASTAAPETPSSLSQAAALLQAALPQTALPQSAAPQSAAPQPPTPATTPAAAFPPGRAAAPPAPPTPPSGTPGAATAPPATQLASVAPEAVLRPAPEDAFNQPQAPARFNMGDPVYVRIFKQEGQLELWLKRNGRYALYRSYPICKWSGHLGPKLREADYQSPEGFYSVSAKQLNPNSHYHRAFNVGYPNAFDRQNGRTGGLVMVHGACKSVGCFAMTDRGIEEIYGFVAAAIAGGQKEVPVHIFPFRMTEANIARETGTGGGVMAFLAGGGGYAQYAAFWENLKEGYELFERSGEPPTAYACGDHYSFGTANGACRKVAGW